MRLQIAAINNNNFVRPVQSSGVTFNTLINVDKRVKSSVTKKVILTASGMIVVELNEHGRSSNSSASEANNQLPREA